MNIFQGERSLSNRGLDMPQLMAEIVNKNTGERSFRRVVREGKNAVYIALGAFGDDRPQGFFVKTGKPVPSNMYKNFRLGVMIYR